MSSKLFCKSGVALCAPLLVAALLALTVTPLAAHENDGSDDGAQSTPSAGMLRYPDVSKDHIVFSYAGDLWIVSREGGTARPLASPAGQELFPPI